ncbi:MAG: hypothetical protein WD928_14330 [Gammaproteobacteria bacterium]
MPESETVYAHDAPPRSESLQQVLSGLGTSVVIARPRCFRSDERLRCRDTGCRWRSECRRLVAEWRR